MPVVLKIIEFTDPDPRKNPNDFEGYLYKYSPSIFKGWQKRYIILKDKKLMYKKTME
mgnify:CR=1 FL=1